MTTDPAPASDRASDAQHRSGRARPGRFAEDRVEEDAALSADVARRRQGPRLQWPLAVVLVGLVVSLMIVAADHFRRGSVLFAACVALAFVLRAVLSEQEAGWLAVRSRRVDLLVLGFLAASLSVFSVIVPPPS